MIRSALTFILLTLVAFPLLAAIPQKKVGSDDGEPSQAEDNSRETENFDNSPLLSDPLVSNQPILFVVRKQYRSDHHNTATLFQTGEINTQSFTGGSALKTIDLGQGGNIKTLLETQQGVIRDPEVHFSGKKIVFSMRKNIDDDYHIYEINADGKGLKQLTFAKGVSDIDPLYMPGGAIVFSSTREPKYCMCNRHIMANLFSMDHDGANIVQIGKSTLFEGHSSLLPDGRILYDRWEYVDRNFGDAQGLWTINPDGTNVSLFWGNNTRSPGGVLDARIIPGTQQTLCILGSCHDRPWGAMAVIDRRLGMDGKAPILRTWPKDAIDLVQKGNYDTFKTVNPKYEDPYPLSDRLFLCSRMTGSKETMGIYVADDAGNEVLIHSEAPGCFDPMPLDPRPCPQAMAPRKDLSKETGEFYLMNAYEGDQMKGVENGEVKYIRVVESPEKRSWTHTSWNGQGIHCPAMSWHDFNNKRILGTAPVEEDGSAYFTLPANRFVYFQLLDKDMMMIQSMRSGTVVAPGERTGCIGCHESRLHAPSIRGGSHKALKRAPSKLQNWYGPPRLFSFIDEVQPVFDKRCVTCHTFGEEAGKKLNLSRDRTMTFNTSFNELWRKKYISVIGAGPAESQLPRSWGSHSSLLVKIILSGHEDVDLTDEEFRRIVTWIDINAPYYPDYFTAYPGNLAGRSPLDNRQIKRLTELTGVTFAKHAGYVENRGPKVSFDRPRLSPCLEKFKNKDSLEYKEALSIIKAGKAMLEQRPRADMQGFIPCAIDQNKNDKFKSREKIEQENRNAVLTKRKLFDNTDRK